MSDLINKHKFWEEALFEKNLLARTLLTFVSLAEYLGTPDSKPTAERVVRHSLTQWGESAHRNLVTALDKEQRAEAILMEHIKTPLLDPPEELVTEAVEYIYSELPPENRDVVRWPSL